MNNIKQKHNEQPDNPIDNHNSFIRPNGEWISFGSPSTREQLESNSNMNYIISDDETHDIIETTTISIEAPLTESFSLVPEIVHSSLLEVDSQLSENPKQNYEFINLSDNSKGHSIPQKSIQGTPDSQIYDISVKLKDLIKGSNKGIEIYEDTTHEEGKIREDEGLVLYILRMEEDDYYVIQEQGLFNSTDSSKRLGILLATDSDNKLVVFRLSFSQEDMEEDPKLEGVQIYLCDFEVDDMVAVELNYPIIAVLNKVQNKNSLLHRWSMDILVAKETRGKAEEISFDKIKPYFEWLQPHTFGSEFIKPSNLQIRIDTDGGIVSVNINDKSHFINANHVNFILSYDTFQEEVVCCLLVSILKPDKSRRVFKMQIRSG